MTRYLRVLSEGFAALAATLERWPHVADLTLRAAVESRHVGGQTLVRPEIHLSAFPEGVELDGEPTASPWLPTHLEALADSGVVLLWPAAPGDLAQEVAATGIAMRTLKVADRELGEGDHLTDKTHERVIRDAQAVRPGPLASLLAQLAREAALPAGVSQASRERVAEQLGRLSLRAA